MQYVYIFLNFIYFLILPQALKKDGVYLKENVINLQTHVN